MVFRFFNDLKNAFYEQVQGMNQCAKESVSKNAGLFRVCQFTEHAKLVLSCLFSYLIRLMFRGVHKKLL
jgi:hypothetical protein